MPLSDRLRKSTASHETDAAGNGRVLPFSCCVDFLTSHSFVTYFRLVPADLHTAIVHLDNFLHSKSTETAPTDATPDAPDVTDVSDAVLAERLLQLPRECLELSTEVVDAPPTSVRRCIECRTGHIEVDEHHGCEVCAHCGLVQTRGSINVSPEFVSGVDDLPPLHKRGGGYVRGVPQWLLHRAADEGTVNYMDDLEHYNVFVNHPPDVLRTCETRLRTWRGGHFSREVRVAAVLLYSRLAPAFMTESDVRQRVRSVVQRAGTRIRNGREVREWTMSGEKMDMVTDETRRFQYPCPDCGCMENSVRTARVHCRVSRAGKVPRYV